MNRNYVLMHKNVHVIGIEIDEDTGSVVKLNDCYEKNHLPLGVCDSNGNISRREINNWWLGRSIPGSRNGLREVLETIEPLGITNTKLLLTKCFGLSLSDHYWIKPFETDIKWESVNFFQNEFSKDMGEILFGDKPKELSSVNFKSPDNTADGNLKKKWIIVNEKRCLLKGGSGFMEQEPYNEVIASKIMERLGISHASYDLKRIKNNVYSICDNFLNTETELIPAWRAITILKKRGNESDYQHLLKCCDKLGIDKVKECIDKMIVVDYIIANEDRHYNNFGFVRNAGDLSWVGFSPIYDSGTSLWYNTPHVGNNVECKPFRKSHYKQLELASDLGWFEKCCLNNIKDEIINVFSKSERIDSKRAESIADSVINKIDNVQKLKEERNKKHYIPKDYHDVIDIRAEKRRAAELPETGNSDPHGHGAI